MGSAICPENGSGYCPCHFVIACCHIGHVLHMTCHSILFPKSTSYPTSWLRIPSLLPCSNHHYKALRHIFHIKSPYFHRVLSPSDSPCSNDFLLSLAYPVLPTCIPFSMKISDLRIRYLGHILRHPGSLESLIIFNNSFSLRTISSPFRRGAPRAHWRELAIAETVHRTTVLSQGAPFFGQFSHEFYQFFTIVE